MAELAAREESAVVRPLRVIEAEIKEIFEEADAALEEKYQQAAPLLIEAKNGHFKGDSVGFYAWAQKKFGKSRTQIMTWTAHAGVAPDKSLKSLHETKYAKKGQGGMGWTRPASRNWTSDVDDVAERARRDAFRLAQEDALTRAQERDAERKLAHRLIDIGFKVLAKELHPDKLYGDREAMKRLNRIRDKLKHSI